MKRWSKRRSQKSFFVIFWVCFLRRSRVAPRTLPGHQKWAKRYENQQKSVKRIWKLVLKPVWPRAFQGGTKGASGHPARSNLVENCTHNRLLNYIFCFTGSCSGLYPHAAEKKQSLPCFERSLPIRLPIVEDMWCHLHLLSVSVLYNCLRGGPLADLAETWGSRCRGYVLSFALVVCICSI